MVSRIVMVFWRALRAARDQSCRTHVLVVTYFEKSGLGEAGPFFNSSYNQTMSERYVLKKSLPSLQTFYFCDDCLALMKQPTRFRQSASKTTYSAYYMGKCSACGRHAKVQPRHLPFRSD